MEFLPNGFFEWIERVIGMSGMVLLSPSLPLMLQALTPVLTGFFAYLILSKEFNLQKVGSVILLVSGIVSSSFVELKYETTTDMFYVTVSGILLCLLSCIFNAVQNILDERLMIKDKNLTIVRVI
jgi:drug/metabolite transporter (DMT)-like permease